MLYSRGRVLIAGLLLLYMLLYCVVVVTAAYSPPIDLDQQIGVLEPGYYAVVRLYYKLGHSWFWCTVEKNGDVHFKIGNRLDIWLHAGSEGIWMEYNGIRVWEKSLNCFEDPEGETLFKVLHYSDKIVVVWLDTGDSYTIQKNLLPEGMRDLPLTIEGAGSIEIVKVGRIEGGGSPHTTTTTVTVTKTVTSPHETTASEIGATLDYRDVKNDRLILTALAVIAVVALAIAFSRGGVRAAAAALLLLFLLFAPVAASATNVVVLGASGVGEQRIIRLERGKKYYIYFEVEYYYDNSRYDIAKLTVVDSSGQVLAASFKKTPSETLEQAIGATVGFFASAIAAAIGVNPNYGSLVDAASKLLSSINCLEQIGVVTLGHAESMCIALGKYLEQKRGKLLGALEIICNVDGSCYALTLSGKQRVGDVLYVYMQPGQAAGGPLKVYVRIDTGVKMSLVLLLLAVVVVTVVGVLALFFYLGGKPRKARARATAQQLMAVVGVLLIIVGLAVGVLVFKAKDSTTVLTPTQTPQFTATATTVTATTTPTWTETRTTTPVFEKEYTVSVPDCGGGQGIITVNIYDRGGQLVADVWGECGPARPMEASSESNPIGLACLWIDGESQGCYYVYMLPNTQYIPAEAGTHNVKVKIFDLR